MYYANSLFPPQSSPRLFAQSFPSKPCGCGAFRRAARRHRAGSARGLGEVLAMRWWSRTRRRGRVTAAITSPGSAHGHTLLLVTGAYPFLRMMKPTLRSAEGIAMLSLRRPPRRGSVIPSSPFRTLGLVAPARRTRGAQLPRPASARCMSVG